VNDDIAVSYAALKAFDAVGRSGGIRRAAAELGVSHVIVSRHLQALERALGTILFLRETGQLTGAGTRYHVRIAKALAEIGEATHEARAATQEQLRIWCAPGLAAQWLIRRLPRFRAARDSYIVNLQSSEVAPDLLNNAADGDIRYVRDGAAPRDRQIRCVELARPEVFPVAAPALAAKLAPQLRDATALLASPLIEEQDAAEWRLWLAGQDIAAPAITPVARYGHAHLALEAARAGQGVALGNPYLVAEDIAEGRLVALSPASGAFEPVALGAYMFSAADARWDATMVARFRRWLGREFAAPMP
jgi:DNA-binding transcriptional LysR family regulator